jgi:pimeloyl-ACP methyl ester carboxylesterase
MQKGERAMINTVDATDAGTRKAVKPQAKQRRKGLGFWIKRLVGGLVIVVVVALAAGAIYQAIATANDERNYPAPGQMVDVGGRRSHIYCTGEGSPTVILESALASTTSTWAWVQPGVANGTRVCTYDRAGSGWSDPGPKPRDGQEVAVELHTLLDKAGVPGPYLLVGHSAGGLYVRAYASRYPGEVVGMVLVDSSHPDQWLRTPGGQEQFSKYERLNRAGSLLGRFGVLRLFNYFHANPDLPRLQSEELKAFNDSAKYTDINSEEFNAIPDLNTQVRNTGNLGSIPLAVLTATDHGYQSALAANASQAQLDQLQLEEQNWRDFQKELAGLSSNSIQQVVDGADHSSLLFKQEHANITTSAILQVVAAVRTGRPLVP